ncbi:arginine--tRNA ligase [Longispora albida]|uniref:arginine--tRNA ligase n=1 Tax=Longispora albida TaxID=203523 RepID=UPI00036D574E|nr:arginine--tRNA ligase [Longispora albida]
MENLEELLTERLAHAMEAATGHPADPALRRSAHADFQADGALALARQLGRPPREIAAAILARSTLDDLVSSAEISGPGFVNLTIRDDVLAGRAGQLAADPRLGVPEVADPGVIVVDYSGPNVAKEMHVGHLRSTVLGDAAARVLGWLGHTVIRINHLGDWGTPFGMLIEHMMEIGEAEASHTLSAGDLSAFYQAARAAFDSDPDFAARSRARVVALQNGDPQTLRLWAQLGAESRKYFMTVYRQLGVLLADADFQGESRYNGDLAGVVSALDGLGLLTESDGALCAFPAGFAGRDGEPLPLIVRKSDGGFGYPATDLAALRSRVDGLGAGRLLYFVGAPQRQHFEMVFQVAREAGWLGGASPEHIAFGSVLGTDGKMLKTRAGGTVKLTELLTEAVTRAEAAIGGRGVPDPAAVARAVGIGAVKYADLSTDRIKDYVFDWDRMLSFDGNTAPYLQYANARIQSILRTAGGAPENGTVVLTNPAERALALELTGFGAVVTRAGETLEFHGLATYLFGLASLFSKFYETSTVLVEDRAVRGSRLTLCAATARTLITGLGLLGIEAPERM